MAIHGAEPLEVVVGWMDAMRRGDREEVRRWLDPEITSTSTRPRTLGTLGRPQLHENAVQVAACGRVDGGEG